MYFGKKISLERLHSLLSSFLKFYENPDRLRSNDSELHQKWLRRIRGMCQIILQWIVRTFADKGSPLIAGLTEHELIKAVEEALTCAHLDQNDPQWDNQRQLLNKILQKIWLDVKREEARRDKGWFQIAQNVDRLIYDPKYFKRFQEQVTIYKDAWTTFFWEPAYQQSDFYSDKILLEDESQEPGGRGWYWTEVTFILRPESESSGLALSTQFVWFSRWHPEIPDMERPLSSPKI